jgi:hypothetical protein
VTAMQNFWESFKELWRQNLFIKVFIVIWIIDCAADIGYTLHLIIKTIMGFIRG